MSASLPVESSLMASRTLAMKALLEYVHECENKGTRASMPGAFLHRNEEGGLELHPLPQESYMASRPSRKANIIVAVIFAATLVAIIAFSAHWGWWF